jgi:hypothetical protein
MKRFGRARLLLEIPRRSKARKTLLVGGWNLCACLWPAPTIFVAVVADNGAVGITGDVGVSLVGASLLVRASGVAIDAGEAGVVGGDLMAIVANGAVVGNWEIIVIESGAEPTGRSVATVAGGGIAGGEVIGHAAAQCLRAIPGGLMAAVASGIGGGQGVIAIDMAGGAGSLAGIGVGSGERPPSRGVIKFSIGPI